MASSEDMTAAELTISNDELCQELVDAEKGLAVVLKENDELKESNNKLKKQLDVELAKQTQPPPTPLYPDGRPSCEPKYRLKIGLPWRLLLKAVLPYEGGEHVWSIGAPYYHNLHKQLRQYYGDAVTWKTQIKYRRACDGEWMVVENDKDVKLAYKDWQYSPYVDTTWLRLFIVVP
ncbi:uncharacterized protein ACA1_055350 [Acanthamoeba castellanii str. Neff]|uniref:Uncharacterized protein n=1 Tax=Acanthamoeba castellanii (strain ATCC 30010 / Neff) TaxID=1257118 RepID=L8H5I2_ACACF|nr:uncharacterized protein ACA1_055350 [Acanthamoeba castellanii str. Neff]ELR20769.1 hypothetical protein ACA1_055350 [Acanthamoeba castellanii str. Neff]